MTIEMDIATIAEMYDRINQVQEHTRNYVLSFFPFYAMVVEATIIRDHYTIKAVTEPSKFMEELYGIDFPKVLVFMDDEISCIDIPEQGKRIEVAMGVAGDFEIVRWE